MNIIRNLPIRSKVVIVTTLTACAALSLAGAALLQLEVFEFRKRMERDVASLAEVIASHSVSAVVRDDRDSAAKALAALHAEPRVLAACIYSKAGRPLAQFSRSGHQAQFPPAPGSNGFTLTANRLTYFAPIRGDLEHVRVGTIYFEAHLDELHDRLISFGKILAGVLAASGLVALGLSAALQRYIAGPIVQLAGATRRVSEDRDYSLRVPRTGTDELGDLVGGFNAMLERIQSHEADVQAVHETLELRVEERTAELQQEVVERRRAEDELAQSLALMAATLEATGDGILVVDRAGQTVDFNRKFVTMWHLPKEIINSRDHEAMVEWGSRQLKDTGAFLKKVRQISNDPEVESYDLLEFSDGRFLERFSKPRHMDGACVGRVISFRDVTARMRAEDRVREQASLLDLAPDAIIVRDMNDVTLFWSKGAERLLGWPAFEVVNRDLEGLFEKDVTHFVEAKRCVLERGEWSGELTHATRNGGEVRTESRWTLLRDDEGRPKSILTINTDITERKKLESQFLRAQRMESIGTLAGGIAHDLNNVLAPILVSVDLLRAQNASPQLEPILESVETSAERGADLVRQILQFARGAEGKRMPISLDRILREICKIGRDTFPKNIRFQHVITPDLWMVSGDATQLHQVLLNLCVNARDAMPEGGTLLLEAVNFTNDGSHGDLPTAPTAGPHVMVRVKDTGIGIPAEVRDRIFEPFFTTKTLGQGTGLGLSTAVAIAKGHGGQLDFTSEQGRGTTFTLCLPALPEVAKEKEPRIAVMPVGQKETLLLVDDEASFRLVIKQTLESFGYRVLVEPDGAGAVATYSQRKHEIALVLTDMMMPGMDGIATIRALKAIDPQVRVIAATGLSTDERMLKATEAGAVAFLRKPFTAEVLLRTIRQAISGVTESKAA